MWSVPESWNICFSFVELKLKALLSALHPVRAKWYNIGLELDILHTDLDTFKQTYSDPLDLMREVLKHWLQTAVDPRPSWEAVVRALRSLIVNEYFVANQLEVEYCTQHETDESPTRDDRTQGKVAAWHVFLHCLYYHRY